MSTQRRTYGFGTPAPSQGSFPRIATPPGLLTRRPGDVKSARLQRRTLGLTHRIWALVCVLLFFFLCIYILTPPPDDAPHHAFTNAHLVPKDYLNASNDPEFAPFDFCPVYGPGDFIAQKYGAHALSRSKLHLGSGARVQRVIRKALSGLPVTISVLGGSISACHGAGNDPISPACYPSRFFQWWNQVFPHPASELTNGAVRRSNSAYFSFCHGHHIPDETDLVILEFDSDDPNESEWLNHFELLVRSILVRRDSPAVVILGHFSPQIQIANGFAGPEFLHSVVAQYYDVPHISTKPVLYSTHLHAPDNILSYYADPILANPSGHTLLADVLVSYFQSQICAGWASATGAGFEVPVFPVGAGKGTPADAKGLFGGAGMRKGVPTEDDADKPPRVGLENDDGSPSSDYAPFRVPPARLHARPNDLADFREVRPFCVSANDLINPLPPSLFYGSGWHAYHPPKGASYTEGGSTAHYWYSTLPTSKLRVPMKMGSGEVAVHYWREEDREENRSSVKCYVDDNVPGAVEIRNYGDGPPGPALKVIDHFVSQGSHFVECELLGEEGGGVPLFKILGIFST
ncbi:hypothetical protein K439DRAFT_1395200 [Ramaria rubella]|nr:hypothetical protein K439DRAFT_1395200 [Ramaria rubella]